MKLTKKLEAEILKAYNECWTAYLEGDLKTHATFLSDQFKFIGTSEGEQFNNKKDWISYCKKTIKQFAGVIQKRQKNVKILPIGEAAMVEENSDLYVLIDGKWTYYSKMRISAVLQKEKTGWKYIHQHGSLPDTRANEGEVIATEQIKKENLQLREAVKRRTTELENKNRELEIEAALERIRTVAMGMKKAEDMLDICRVISNELEELGIDEIRNIQTAIIDEEKASYLNYEYFRLKKKTTITAVEYKKQKDVAAFVRKILKGPDSFFTKTFKGDEIEDWMTYQAKAGQWVDPHLKKIKSLHYYFYSIGRGALGISTYAPLPNEAVSLFKRFRNVFQLAYQRFVDIQKAEAQAREAQIEACLERVRASSMAMHHSSDLHKVVSVMTVQLSGLGLKFNVVSFTKINDDDSWEMWLFTPEQPYPVQIHVPYLNHGIFNGINEQARKGKDFFADVWDKKEKNIFFRHFFENTTAKNTPQKRKQYVYNCKGFARSNFLTRNIWFTVSIYDVTPFSDGDNSILSRFANVFEQCYTRFLDLQKAEEQAREARIEAALERVRSRAMAMHSSQELKEVALELRNQMGLMAQPELEVCAIHLYDESPDYFESWAAVPVLDEQGGLIEVQVKFPKRGIGIVDEMLEQYYSGKKDYILVNQGRKLLEWLDQLKEKVPQGYEMILQNFKGTPAEKITSYWSMADFAGGSLVMTTYVPPNEEARTLLRRFANVFGLAYQRFVDLKKAEAQAREAQIELGLERVRARAMAMQKSEELKDLIATVSAELGKLDFILDRCFINIIDPVTLGMTWWMANPEIPLEQMGLSMRYHEHPPYLAHLNAWREGRTKWVYVLEGAVKKEWDKFLFVETDFSKLPAVVAKNMQAVEKVYLNCSFNKFGFLSLATIESLTEEQSDIMVRFAKVFDLTYTRFNDLQKAEAQARESQIQLGLERVRARTMAMHHSSELADVATVLFQQVKALGVPQWACGFSIWEIGDKESTWYPGGANGEILAPAKMPLTEHPVFIQMNESRKRGDELYIYEKTGEVQADHYRYMMTVPGLRELLQNILDAGLSFPAFQIDHYANFSHGNLIFITYEHFPHMHDVFKRFAKVFEQTYTRFLDLQKAEAQAREARIEAGLERVRSRSLAMHKSDELQEVVANVFERLKELEIEMDTSSIIVPTKNENEIEYWFTNVEGYLTGFKLPHFDNRIAGDVFNAKKKGIELLSKNYSFEEKNEFWNYLVENTDFQRLPASRKKFILDSEGFTISIAFSKNTGIQINRYYNKPFSEEENEILRRFARVFEQAYTRFLDLQNAEAQAREGQIQLALERVRARTMAMQKSEELSETSFVLFQQLKELGEDSDQITIGIFEEDDPVITLYATSRGSQWTRGARIELSKHSVYPRIHSAWKNNLKLFVIDISGKELEALNKFKLESPDYQIWSADELPKDRWLFYCAYFSKGFVSLGTSIPRSNESIHLLERFAQVFEQTYTRFLDLQKAEAQAREGQIQLALERVRARTMAMQRSDELLEVVSTLYEQLNNLQFDSNACNIIIIDKESNNQRYWVSGFTQKLYPESYNVPYFKHPYIDDQLQAWKEGRNYIVIEYSGKMKHEFDKQFFSQTDFKNIPVEVQKIISALPSAKLSTAFFTYGALQIIGPYPLSEENAAILQRFAKVFDQTYTRFLDLQKAEAQAREAQIQLALERVRARTMAMHNSEDVTSATNTMFDELEKLGLDNLRCGVVNIHYNRTFDVFGTTHLATGNKMTGFGLFGMDEHPIWQRWFESWMNKEEVFIAYIAGQEKEEYFNVINSHSNYLPQQIVNFPDSFFQAYYFDEGAVWAYSSQEHSDSEKDIMKRFATGFSLTFRRYQDLKKAEAQAKEARIEAALEKVRSRSLAMHRSDELQEVVHTVIERLRELDIEVYTTIIIVFTENSKDIHWWLENKKNDQHPRILLKYADVPYLKDLFDARENKKELFSKCYVGKEKKDLYQYLFDHTDLRNVSDDQKEFLFGNEFATISIAFAKNTAIHITSYSKKSFSEEETDILKRFAKVFDQAYTRFLDLQKAEAQARGAQIEASLERVRAKAMAMHKSDDLHQAVATVFEELDKLKIGILRCGIAIMDKEKPRGDIWVTVKSEQGSQIQLSGAEPLDYHPLLQGAYDAWLKQEHFSYVLNAEELAAYYQAVTRVNFQLPISETFDAERQDQMQFYYNAVFRDGSLFAFMEGGPNDEAMTVMNRFAKVFDLTYKRFLDLQRAEAQAREAQIEAALERVRSRTMAMHQSGEIADIVGKIFGELKQLDLVLNRVLIWIFNDDERYMTWWSANPEAASNAESYRVDYNDQPVFLSYLQAWQKRTPLHLYTLSGDLKKKWEDHLFTNTELSKLPLAVRKGMREEGTIFTTSTISDYGLMMVGSFEPLSDGNIDIIQRFGRVFQQSYTRYLDVQKAEAQAREAQIEVSLERVRARAMAMHKTNELLDAAELVYKELSTLGFASFNISYAFVDKEEKYGSYYSINPVDGKIPPFPFVFPHTETEVMRSLLSSWKTQEPFHVIELDEDATVNHQTYIGEHIHRLIIMNKIDIPFSVESFLEISPKTAVIYSFNFAQGYLFIIGEDRLSTEQEQIAVRFTKVFELTYRRFLDLTQAETQARESQIEAALERVRAKAMAMHQSQDLGETIRTFYQQLDSLKLMPRRCGVGLIDRQSRIADLTGMVISEQGETKEIAGQLKLQDHPVLISIYDSWIQQQEYQPILRGNEIGEYYQRIGAQISIQSYPEDAVQYGYFFFFREGTVYAWTEKPFAEDELKIYRRFTAVLSLTYKRYKDLKQAEAQAREARIEAGLERVRARTMAMHNSEDVSLATATMLSELEKLDIQNFRGGILNIRVDETMEVWSINTLEDGSIVRAIGDFDMRMHPYWQQLYEGWKNKDDYAYFQMIGKDKEDYIRILDARRDYLPNGMPPLPDSHVQSYFFDAGAVWTFSLQPHTEENKQVMKRFAAVFSLTFRRYQDLKNAEAQAREAKIEASLEKIRSKAMAMHNSQDLTDTIGVFYRELKSFSLTPIRCGVGLLDREERIGELFTWNTTEAGESLQLVGRLKMEGHPVLENVYKHWQTQTEYQPVLRGNEIKEYYQVLRPQIAFPDYTNDDVQYGYFFFFREGGVYAWTEKEMSDDELQIYRRFTSVLSLTYKRYNDLRIAEANAREAKIEAAMEKVRARAMAMQKPDELVDVAQLLRKEMGLLGVEELEGSAIFIHNEATGKTECWYAIKDDRREKLGADHITMDLNDTWVGRQMLQFYHSDNKQISIPMLGDHRKEWIHYFSERSSAMAGFYSETVPDRIYHLFKFSNGFIGATSPGEISAESWGLLQRATTVFSLAYTRFSDLQQAEANAKEAVKQAALDRVRAEIASMRTVGDLERITPLIWNELTILGLPFIRCGVFIMDEAQQTIHTFLSTPDGKAIAAFHLPYSTPGNLGLVLSHWQAKKIYVGHWDESSFRELARILMQQGAIVSEDQYLSTLPRGGFYLHFLPFLQGMLYVGNTSQLGDDDIKLIQHVADAFSTAYARYEDFNKLEAAKLQVEQTLTDLKQAQTQLVQSEKMASLGELTAGIAHEIQNPLNFVNNFSDVSNELLQEMKYELERGNAGDAMALAEDVKQNLEKILHHGKRADAIVKGMLQHSRASSGQKELTDINMLADEYLRLAYHGLRAKDKSFNAKFETDFDSALEKVNVVPQEIGRVILNLINNAFYAVNEKKKQVADAHLTDRQVYEPTVTIATRKTNGRVSISVIDNGIGIPQKSLDKIFQPFFTTKPTSQGTGLGLSLAFDIVTKGHGGELKVETREGEGSEFIVSLPG